MVRPRCVLFVVLHCMLTVESCVDQTVVIFTFAHNNVLCVQSTYCNHSVQSKMICGGVPKTKRQRVLRVCGCQSQRNDAKSALEKEKCVRFFFMLQLASPKPRCGPGVWEISARCMTCLVRTVPLVSRQSRHTSSQ